MIKKISAQISPQFPAYISPQLRFVLCTPSHPGNIGSAARALKVMGWQRLELVNPRVPRFFANQEAMALASGALDVLEGAQIHESLPQALAGTHISFAMTARAREFSASRHDLREAGELAAAALQAGKQVAFVLGTEKFGLSNEEVQSCSHLVHVPTDAHYGSLNLAQALQLAAYECRMAVLAQSTQFAQTPHATPFPATNVLPVATVGFVGASANHEQIEGLFQHLEQTLVAVNYLNPDEPKKLMPRLRRLLARSHVEVEEVNILRGICKAILHKIS